MHDTTMRGGKLRMLTVLDEYTRQSRCIHVDRKINARKVRSIMSRLIAEHGAPEHIRSDNGSEFIESFHARLRDECLNREMLYTLTEARVVVEDWRWKYNHLRPHGSLGYISPIEFEQKLESESSTQGKSSSRPPASFRPSLDLLYTLNHYITTSRLTV